MSTKTLTQRTTDRKRTSPQSGIVADQYIEAQLNRTRRDVKLVDLSGALMVLGAAVLGTLLVLALIDHWIVPLGALARWILLVAIVVSAGWYFIQAIVPLLIGTVNPIYAARTIERSEPTLKNSLVNYLMFRDDRAGLRTGIYEALKQQAAADLTHVPIDSAVDRTRLIRIGYALAAILALFAAYTIVSPKNPFQTAQRVILPWADIAPPTRVRIEDVQPGDQQVYFGDRVRVTATCFDLRADEPVTLFYSSQDGRISNQSIPLTHTGTGLQYEAMLPQDDEGIAQDLIYRIEAGDAVTASYRLTVQPAPTLLVQQIEYEYPRYTGQPDRVVQRRGDVRGIEGTQVTIRAQANHPIRWATIVLNPQRNSNNSSSDGAAAPVGNSTSEMVSMQFDDQQAWGTFMLEMHPDNQPPKHTSYLLRFETESGQINARAPEYRIEVMRDLTPEIEILTPTAPRIELPVDRRQGIEVRAIDPDFGLTNIELQAVAGGEQLLLETLFADAQGRTGQVVRTYQLEPWMLGLRPGDSLMFWASAEDNRVAVRTGQPAPNRARTSSVHVTILPPEDPATGPQPTLADPEQAPDDTAKPSDAAGPDPADASDDPMGPDQSQDSPDDTADGADQADDGGTSGGEAEDSSSSTGASSSADGQPGASDSDAAPDGGDTASGGSDDSSPGSGTTDDSQRSPGSQPTEGREGSSTRAGDSPGDAAADQDGWDDQPLHDGEVVERTLEHIQSQKPDDRTAPSSDSLPGESPDSQPSGAQDADPSGDAPVDETASMGDQGLDPSTPSPDDMAGDASGDTTDEGGQPGGAERAESESGQPQGDDSDDAQGGLGDDGQSGAGQGNQDPTGAPAAMEENVDRPKDGDADGDLQQTSEEAPSPSQSEHQSDSQGEGQGDESGGGEQGGGQGSQQEGSDSSGSHSPAEQGGDAADGSGTGDTAPRPGDQQTADGPTDVPGSEQGDGSSTQPSDGADGPGAVPDDASEPSSGERPAGQPSPSESEKPGPGQPMGGGRPGELDSPHSGAPEGETGDDEPNLQYAQRSTDLVLEYLRDQQQNPDPELLERLRWSEEDLRRFLNRWEDLQRNATDDQQGQQEWNDALRSLGLRPQQQGSRRVSAPADAVQGLRDTGTQSRPPGRYLEQFNAFKKGTARVDE